MTDAPGQHGAAGSGRGGSRAAGGGAPERPRRSPRDLQVLLLAALIVVAVIGVDALSNAVPPLDAALGSAPLVIGLLVAVTLVVLVGTLRRRSTR